MATNKQIVRRLHDRVAVVTGAGSGIGRATALRFAKEGARVVGVDLQAGAVLETASLIEEMGGHALAVEADVTDSAKVQEAVARAVETHGRLDIVFNGAGASGRRWGDGRVDECTEEGWERTLAVNLTSVYLVCKYTVPWLLQSRGAIVNLASVLGMGGDRDFETHAYAASKGAIIALTRSMAVTYAPHHLRVNVIAPGLIATPMSRRAQEDPQILARLPELQPLTGAMGAPEDVAAAAAYLASDDARFVTGQVLAVDGGWTAR